MPNETRADDPVYCREGQGESLGPSVLSSLLERLEAWDRAEEMMRDRARMSEIRMWRDAEPYWGTYGSQNREAVPRWTGTSTSAGLPITYDDLNRAWDCPYRPTRETTRERGEQMRFSGKPDPLTSEEKARVERFYRKVLQDGFAQWPLDGLRLPIFINGKVRRLYSDTRWSCQDEYIYIGVSRDEGSGDFSSPAARLAFTTTLMGMTGHSSSPELIGLLSERLAKVMAGVYDSVVKPLAETSDSRPVRRMAWSASGGLASWIDGEWVGLTGEPVAVGAGWTVIDTEEGPVVDGLPPVQSGRVPRSSAGGYAEMVRDMNLSERFEDGIQIIPCSREAYDRIIERGYTGIAYDAVRQGVVSTETETAVSALTHAQWEEIKERFDQWAALWARTRTEDGRSCVAFNGSQEALEDRRLVAGLIGCVVEKDTFGEWAITYPPEPPLDQVEEEFPF